MLGIGIIMGASGIGLVVMFFALLHLKKLNRKLARSDYHANKLIDELESRIEGFEDRIKADEVELGKRNDAIEELRQANTTKRERIVELEKELKGFGVGGAAEEVVQQKLAEKMSELKELEEAEHQKLEELEKEREVLVKEKAKIECELNEMRQQVEVLKCQAIAARHVVEEGGADGVGCATTGLDFAKELSRHDKRLMELVDEVVDEVPELEKELMGVIWKKVWLPHIQDVMKKTVLVDGGRLGDGVCGIYKLVRKNDGAVYVGKAVDVKTRGYQHMKKMLGVEDCGGEWLYESGDGIEDGVGYVIEVVDNKKELDERERFWIDLIGDLNKA